MVVKQDAEILARSTIGHADSRVVAAQNAPGAVGLSLGQSDPLRDRFNEGSLLSSRP